MPEGDFSDRNNGLRSFMRPLFVSWTLCPADVSLEESASAVTSGFYSFRDEADTAAVFLFLFVR